MRNLLIFISKYNAFFFFIFFFIASLILVVRNNSFQKASVLNSSNLIIGQSYERINTLKEYLNLKEENEALLIENSRLRSSLKNSFYVDSIQQKTVKDTTLLQEYTYVPAQVVNNSINQKNNTLTINRGKRHGIQRGMGVICATGLVGIVDNVSNHYATIKSLLHQDTRISARIAENKAFGSLVWGAENYDPRIAILKDIPDHIEVKRGYSIVTSGYSALFPAGISIGKALTTRNKNGVASSDIKVKLSTDFSTLSYVYVIISRLSAERQALEIQTQENK